MTEGIASAKVYYKRLPPEEVIFGMSSAMEEVREKLEKVARTDIPILIRGEAGSGKEILARLFHQRNPGETTPFHKVMPAGRDGWRKTASFIVPRHQTSGNGDGHGHHSDHGRTTCIGSLFFDEVAELNLASQRSLMQLLHDDKSSSLGTAEYGSPLFRVICSTRHDIEREMAVGRFREDLFYAINVVSLELPPLRARREDMPGLVQYFWHRFQSEFDSDSCEPSSRLIEMFQAYDWPGNIRELSNTMKRFVLLGSEEKLIDELDERLQSPAAREAVSGEGISLKRLTRLEAHELERKIILRTLRETHWNRKQAARALDISYRTLLYKIKEAGVPPKRIVVNRRNQS